MRTATLPTLALAALVAAASAPAFAQSGYANTEQLRREAQRSFSSLDRNRDGWLSGNEMAGYGGASASMMDADGDGRVTRQEFIETHRQFSDASPTSPADRAAAPRTSTTMSGTTGMGTGSDMHGGTAAQTVPGTPGYTYTTRSAPAGEDRSMSRGGGETGPDTGTMGQDSSMQHGSSGMTGGSGGMSSFDRMDLNGDGVIGRDEFTTGSATAFGMHDLNGDGRISRSEYDRLMRQ